MTERITPPRSLRNSQKPAKKPISSPSCWAKGIMPATLQNPRLVSQLRRLSPKTRASVIAIEACDEFAQVHHKQQADVDRLSNQLGWLSLQANKKKAHLVDDNQLPLATMEPKGTPAQARESGDLKLKARQSLSLDLVLATMPVDNQVLEARLSRRRRSDDWLEICEDDLF